MHIIAEERVEKKGYQDISSGINLPKVGIEMIWQIKLSENHLNSVRELLCANNNNLIIQYDQRPVYDPSCLKRPKNAPESRMYKVYEHRASAWLDDGVAEAGVEAEALTPGS